MSEPVKDSIVVYSASESGKDWAYAGVVIGLFGCEIMVVSKIKNGPVCLHPLNVVPEGCSRHQTYYVFPED